MPTPIGRLARFAPGGLALFLTVACSSDGMQSKFHDTSRAYNRHLRWGDDDRAAEYLPPAARDAFLSLRERVSEHLVVVDYELTRLELDKETGAATSRAVISWHTEDRLIVETTQVDQLWQWHNGNFVLVDERRSGGTPLAIFAEPESGDHPYLPGLDRYRKAHQIGKENKKRAKKAKATAKRGDRQGS